MDSSSPLTTYDLAERVASVACPTLVIGSDSDANYAAPVRIHAASIHESAKDSELTVIPASGHFSFITSQFRIVRQSRHSSRAALDPIMKVPPE